MMSFKKVFKDLIFYWEPETRKIAKGLLNDLKSGNENYWRYVPQFVEDGYLTYDEAIDGLYICLKKNIPVYEGLLDTISIDKLKEAREALESIESGEHVVTYRGTSIEFTI